MAVLEVVGLREAILYFQRLPQNLDAAGYNAMVAIERDVADRAVENAPIRTGVLRKNIQPGKISILNGTILGGVGVYSTGKYPEKYNGGKTHVRVAVLMHRYLMPFNTGQGRFNLGPLSKQQPTTSDGGVGGDFIGRAVKKNAASYLLRIQNIFQTFLASSTFGIP